MAYEDEPSLLSWMREHLDETSEELIYKKAGTKQMCFFRDYISVIFLHPNTSSAAGNHFCHIGGWHRSKSVPLPVYHIKTPHVEIWARDNFYNWNVTVCADRQIALPDYFACSIDFYKNYLFMEGMENKKKPTYGENKQEFSFCLWGGHGDYQLYAIMRAIAAHFEPCLPPPYVEPERKQGSHEPDQSLPVPAAPGETQGNH